jgi:hypothetical protein
MSNNSSPLPARPSLEQLRKQAKELLKAYQAGDASAIKRLRGHIRRLNDAEQYASAGLADAQLVLAREYGFESWARLVHHVMALQPSEPTALFEKLLMPSDEDFRHIGRCEKLEDLWCMYCRETGDMATEHIAGLSRLRTYYAGGTQITDRSLEILSRMPSLESLEFFDCAGITNRGVAHLTSLPRLRELTVGGHPTSRAMGCRSSPRRSARTTGRAGEILVWKDSYLAG